MQILAIIYKLRRCVLSAVALFTRRPTARVLRGHTRLHRTACIHSVLHMSAIEAVRYVCHRQIMDIFQECQGPIRYSNIRIHTDVSSCLVSPATCEIIKQQHFMHLIATLRAHSRASASVLFPAPFRWRIVAQILHTLAHERTHVFTFVVAVAKTAAAIPAVH